MMVCDDKSKHYEVVVKLDKSIQNFLERANYEVSNVAQLEIEASEKIGLIKVLHISYDRSKTETDLNLIDFQQLLGAIASKSKKLVYVVDGSPDGVSLYIGTTDQDENVNFLKDTFEGIYSGSMVSAEDKNRSIVGDKMKYSKAMLGIPSLKRDSDKSYKQSLEKILFPMQGKRYRIVLVAESYQVGTIKEIIHAYRELGGEVHRFAKQSISIQKSKAETNGTANTKGDSEAITIGGSESIAETEGKSESDSSGHTSGKSKSLLDSLTSKDKSFWKTLLFIDSTNSSKTTSVNTSTTKTAATNKSKTNTTSYSATDSCSTTISSTFGSTVEEINKTAEYCESLIDKYIERFQKGMNYGMWNVSLYIQGEDTITLSELEHTLKSVYSGDETHYESIRFSDTLPEDIEISEYPMIYFRDFEHPIHGSFGGLSSALNTEELSILTALPNNDVDGVSVSKVSDFGLTQSKNIEKYKSIDIGMVLNKKKPTRQKFKLSTDALNSHLFVSGITGSGKSNTIKLILEQLQSGDLEPKIPFLVIEPAKSEYKHLIGKMANLQVFRPGAKNDIFKLNPFVFEHSRKNSSVTLTKHIDMLKTTFSSAFPMYGPMPYILEEAIHNVYKNKGWNFETEDHPYYTDSREANYDRKSLLFPNMEDLKEEVERVVDSAGYYQDLQNNIKAALKTRINNLTLGIKGKIFNSRHTFDSKILFEAPTVIELSNIVDDEEKAFLMGLILNKLYAYKEEKGSNGKLNHITVIEEAHRLLPNISLDKSSEEASSRAKAIETFTNILAEIRAYGEGIIIADQIASKLHRDVIKNTNIKIIHRTMDYEDRDIVGKAINLTDDQILDIAELKAGEAIVHNRDVHQAFMVKIDEFAEEKISNDEISKCYAKFIEKYADYEYELLFERWFYLENQDKPDMDKFDFDILKVKFIEFINSIFFDSKNILENWEKLKNNIGDFEHEKAYIYAVTKVWNKLNYFSNMQFYKNIDGYMDANKSLIILLCTIIENKKDKVYERVENFKNSFCHFSLKKVYPSMKYYQDDDTDYTLLLLENITSNKEIYEYLNETMKESIPLNDRFDKILQKIFKTTNPQLRYSIGAIRSGRKELDLSIIAKEGF